MTRVKCEKSGLGAMQVEYAKKDPDQFGPVQNVSSVIEAVQKPLAFRLEQEQKVADAIKQIEEIEGKGPARFVGPSKRDHTRHFSPRAPRNRASIDRPAIIA